MYLRGCDSSRNADLVDRLDERGGAAVHDRHFAGVDLDVAVVDAEAAQSREQMLDRADRHPESSPSTVHRVKFFT
jgi:hypothetical protein